MRDAIPLQSIQVRERAYNFSARSRVGRGARIVLTIVNTVTRLENWNSKLRIIRSVKFHAYGPIPRAWANPHDTKNPYEEVLSWFL
jgi:hypothetical protein